MENKKNTAIGCVSIIAIIVIGSLILRWAGCVGDSPKSNGSGGTSTEQHACGQCGKSFSGNGWSTAGGEQFQQDSWSGHGYCSKKCAYDSQPARWKK